MVSLFAIFPSGAMWSNLVRLTTTTFNKPTFNRSQASSLPAAMRPSAPLHTASRATNAARVNFQDTKRETPRSNESWKASWHSKPSFYFQQYNNGWLAAIAAGIFAQQATQDNNSDSDKEKDSKSIEQAAPKSLITQFQDFWTRIPHNPMVWFDDNFHEVQAGKCYRSKTLPPEALEKHIQEAGIKVILNLREADDKAVWFAKEKEIAQRNGVELHTVTLAGQRLPTQAEVASIIDIFNNAKGPILIHCQAGADRTGLGAALWIAEKMGGSLEDALAQQRLKYGHIKYIYPNMRRFTKIWYQLKAENGNNWREALKAYQPADYAPKAA